MAEREEVLDTLAAVFVVQIEKLDDKNYPYWHTETMWHDHYKAAEALTDMRGNDKRRIILRHLRNTNIGMVHWFDVMVVWQAGKWVSGVHDPRAKDPQYREYLRLKEIYGEDES